MADERTEKQKVFFELRRLDNTVLLFFHRLSSASASSTSEYFLILGLWARLFVSIMAAMVS